MNEAEEATCARLNRIEQYLNDPYSVEPISNRDTLWLISQIRSWQKFAKRVVDFGEVVSKDTVLEKEYEKLFKAVYTDLGAG